MFNFFPTRSAAHQPLWLRTALAVWMLLFAGIGTAQAAHTHGEFFPHRAAQVAAQADSSTLPATQDRCPLCTAVHFALPMVTSSFATALVNAAQLLPVAHRGAARAAWHFARFSRPPPVSFA